MNPKLIWQETQAKLADYDRAAAQRQREGEAHRACKVCGLLNSPEAQACAHCGRPLANDKPL
jgi:uncharacterized OB-fold protein